MWSSFLQVLDHGCALSCMAATSATILRSSLRMIWCTSITVDELLSRVSMRWHYQLGSTHFGLCPLAPNAYVCSIDVARARLLAKFKLILYTILRLQRPEDAGRTYKCQRYYEIILSSSPDFQISFVARCHMGPALSLVSYIF